MNLPSGWELVLIVVVIVLLFGARKLPDTARGLGRSLRIFKSEIRGDEEEKAASNPPAINPGVPPAPPANPVPPVDQPYQSNQPYQQPNQPYQQPYQQQPYQQQPNQPYEQPNNHPQGGAYPTNAPASESQPRDR
jgi:sec-independent protein translocase protein TatA